MYKNKILIVEDETIIAVDLKKVLQDRNYDVTGIVTSGEDAIQFVRNNVPDLILMDIQLKGKLDGIETAALLKDLFDIPVIYLTAYSDEKTLTRAKITEPFGYVVKPFEEKELYGSIEMALYKFTSDKKLREIEGRYKALYNSPLYLIYIHDMEGNLIDANPAALNILDISHYEINSINISGFINRDQLPVIYNLIEELKDKKLQTDIIELEITARNGTKHFVEVTASLVYRNNLPYAAQFIGRDITERKKALAELVKSELRYRTLIETSIDPIYVLHGRRLLLVNHAWEKLFGYTAEDVSSENFDVMQIVAPESVKNIEKRFERFKANYAPAAIPSRYEMTGISKDGRLIQLEVSVSEIIWKGKPAVQGIYRDITERKNTEEQIRMLSLAVKQSSASIIITNIEGTIEYVNPKFTQTTGYSMEEAIGKSPGILSTNNLNEETKEHIRSSIASGKEWRGEFLNKKKNGELFWESATISPIMNEDGKVSHFLSVQEDITLRKKQETQLIIAKENAEKSDKLKTEFLAQMSHEIRTPLNNILAYTSVLKEEFEDKLPEGLESTFQVIDSSSQRLIRTIELVLNLSRIQTGNYDTNFETTNLEKDLLEDVILEFYSRAKQKNISLTFTNNADDFIVTTDRYSISQVFVNLIDNAIKYTEHGEVAVTIYNRENKVCVDISDTGIGISSEYLTKLFNPFSQEDSGMTRHFEGIGLGLALVKKYVEINKADIKVASTKGKGTTFTIIFDPLKK